MKYSELTTIRDFIRFAMSAFRASGLYYGHGTDNPWDEAIALILHTLHLPHDINPILLDAHLIKEERFQLLHLINERVNKKIPVPYLTHEAWFAGLSFYVDERVLIPRSPIAELIENQFEPWLKNNEPERILDLCTGSACIAIACAKAFPDAEIDGSDISEEALVVAKINKLKHSVEDQVNLIQSDLFNHLPAKQYDLIISNPPYVSIEEMMILPEEYHHEPKLALAADHDGLNFILRILKSAGTFLKPDGLLFVETGNSEVALQEMFPQVAFTWLQFERGGDGVFLLSKQQLDEYQAIFDNANKTE